MLPFQDAPYRFFPPKHNWVISALARWVNRRVVLPGRGHRVRHIDVTGAERLRDLTRRRDVRLLFLPNHPTHSDPQIVTELLRRSGLRTAFMAAYDVFLRGKFQAWLMQRTGSFSVDRDASDTQSLKTAIATLADGRGSLTIFPEGNVHLTNDRPASFLEGAAFVGMKAQKQLGDAAEVFAVPVAIKATHLTDVRPAVHRQLAEIAGSLGTPFDAAAPALTEIRRVGMVAVERNLKMRGYPPPEPGEDPGDHVRRCAEIILQGLEGKIGIAAKSGAGLSERARRARAAVHQVRSDPAREIDHPAATAWADEAMLALRLLGYAGNYLASQPTLDRYAETSERIAEDLFSRPLRPFGHRHVFAAILEPVSLRAALGGGGARSKDVVQDLTKSCESAIQQALDGINAANPHPGGARLE